MIRPHPLLVGLAAAVLTSSAHADWRRISDIHLNTAYTLDEGNLEVGIFSPLSVGVTETFQAAIHPLLLLLGQPSLAFRQRLTPVDDVTVALNLAGTWSFIKRETSDGKPASDAGGETLGYPGTLQLTATTSIALSERWLISAGAGVAADFLGSDPIRALAELHLSTHWLVSSHHLLMMQFLGFLTMHPDVELIRPSAQVLYAWSIGATTQLAFGLGVGDWQWEADSGTRTNVRFFPMLDLWFRF